MCKEQCERGEIASLSLIRTPLGLVAIRVLPNNLAPVSMEMPQAFYLSSHIEKELQERYISALRSQINGNEAITRIEDYFAALRRSRIDYFADLKES